MTSQTLQRTTFETSRELEYFSQKELRAQIGHSPELWPVAILRELIDNALDASELGGGLPEIDIVLDDDKIIVTDNGRGILPETLRKSLDYLVRVSDKAFYVSPTRGQLGNALKVIWAAPFVATGKGFAEIEARGTLHRIEVTVDQIAQCPRVTHDVEPALVRIGTSVKLWWPDSTSRLLASALASFPSSPMAKTLVENYAAFNPHAGFTLNGDRLDRTEAGWTKWRPDNPTSAHWYTEQTLRDLIAAYLAVERNGGQPKTVREFVSTFRGLSGTAKQKLVIANWSRSYLRDFVVAGDLDMGFVRNLLERMQTHSAAPKPQMLGVLGKAHMTAWMVRSGVAADSIKYKRLMGVDHLPYVLEIAFGVNKNDDSRRRIVTGLNWSPVIGDAPDETLRQAIAAARLDPYDPVTLLVHMARPRFEFADRGKTRIS